MQDNLFYHLGMKSTINRLIRDDDFCFTGTRICTRRFDPSNACHKCLGKQPGILPGLTGRAGIITRTGKMTMAGTI